MFLDKLIKENQLLIDYSLMMHKQGVFLPDTYVIDIDQVIENAKRILNECGSDITPYFMLKQLGRNPYIAKKLINLGYSGAVAVDFKDVITLMENDIPIRHVGHLVQIPSKLIQMVLEYGVEFITVYSYEKAAEISKVAKKLNITQKLFVKIYSSKEHLYNGQYSGFHKNEAIRQIKEINILPNVQVEGLTTFPAFIYSQDKDDVVETENLHALLQVKDELQKENIHISEVNLPSSNCVYNIPLAKSYGATSVEPGHGLSGTTMLHQDHSLDEKISYLYLSEVSHTFDSDSYVYGGGFYARGNLSKALVTVDKKPVKAYPLSPESIDYHLQIEGIHKTGSPVIMCFRTQMFVTRSQIALVEGLHSKAPKIVGIYNTQGGQL